MKQKIQDLCQQLEAEHSALLQLVEEGKESNRKRADVLTKKEKALEEREAEVAKLEAKATAIVAEVEMRWSKIRRDDEVQAQYEQVIQKEEKLKKEIQENKDRLAEVNLLTERLHEGERALSEREKSYKEKIKKDFAESILGGK